MLLLELGADPNAGGTAGPLALLEPHLSHASRSQLATLLLQHGADCLLPACIDVHASSTSFSLLSECASRPETRSFAGILLSHLERQRAAGQLQQGSAMRAGQLLLGAALCWHARLFNHGLHCLEAHLGAAAGGDVTTEIADVLRDVLFAVVQDSRHDSPASLQQLVCSRLPLDLAAINWNHRSLMVDAVLARGGTADTKLQLLHRAGAQVTAADLAIVVDTPSLPAVAALLLIGRPAVDTSEPAHDSFYKTSYSCPLHRALHSQVCVASLGPGAV